MKDTEEVYWGYREQRTQGKLREWSRTRISGGWHWIGKVVMMKAGGRQMA